MSGINYSLTFYLDWARVVFGENSRAVSFMEEQIQFYGSNYEVLLHPNLMLDLLERIELESKNKERRMIH